MLNHGLQLSVELTNMLLKMVQHIYSTLANSQSRILKCSLLGHA